jgi:hypothetical protein
MKRNKLRVLSLAFLASLGTLGMVSCGSKDEPAEPTEVQTTLDSISVKDAKNKFSVGDEFASTGLKVTATYSDKTTKDVTSKAQIDSSKVNKNQAGTYQIIVSYEGKSATYNVVYEAAPVAKTLEDIVVVTTDAKLTYIIGQDTEFDKTNIVVKANYSNGDEDAVALKDVTFDTSKINFTTAGTYQVDVSFGGKSTSFDVLVQKEQYHAVFKLTELGLIPPVSVVEKTSKTDGVMVFGTEVEKGNIANDLWQSAADGDEHLTKLSFLDPEKKIKLQAYNDVKDDDSADTTIKEIDGKTYSGRVQLGGTGNTTKTCFKIETFGKAKLTLLACASGDTDIRPLIVTDGADYSKQYTTTTTPEGFVYDLPAKGTYYIYSGKSSINIYDFVLDYSVDKDTVTENASIEIDTEKCKIEFSNNEPFSYEGLVVKTLSSLNDAKILADTDYTVKLNLIQGEQKIEKEDIKTAGQYEVVVTYGQMTQSYQISVFDSSLTIISIKLNSSPDKKTYYDDEELDYTGLTFVAVLSDNTEKSLDADEYDLSYDTLTADGEQTITATLKSNTSLTAEAKVNRYFGTKIIDATSVPTDQVKDGTLNVAGAKLVMTYADPDNTKKNAEGEITHKVYAYAEGVTDNIGDEVNEANCMANVGKYVVKFTSGDVTAIKVIEVKEISTVVLNANDLTPIPKENCTADIIVNDTFTILKSCAVDSSNKTIDGVEFTQRIKTNGKGDSTKQAVKITLSKGAQIKVYFACGSNDAGKERTCDLFGSSKTVLASSENLANAGYTKTFTVENAGTYYIGNVSQGGMCIYGIEVIYS